MGAAFLAAVHICDDGCKLEGPSELAGGHGRTGSTLIPLSLDENEIYANSNSNSDAPGVLLFLDSKSLVMYVRAVGSGAARARRQFLQAPTQMENVVEDESPSD